MSSQFMIWVSMSDLGDVLLDPLQHKALVKQTSIEIPIFLDVLSSEETKESDTVVEGDKDHVVFRSLDELCAVGVRGRVEDVAYMKGEPNQPRNCI